jgi:ubiquinone/menaquinone biosynthesis C-methylase UbiE
VGAESPTAAFAFGEEESRRVEAIYLTLDIVAQRARVLAALGLKSGERVVDLGCGPGLLAWEMAQQVGSAGEVQCLDASQSMVALATRRCSGQPWVQVRSGDVTALPYADGGFDAVVSMQVYEYVPEVDRALAEVHRVLRPGGRAIIVDTDWESCVWHSSDPARMRRVVETWDLHCPHPQLPRTLERRLRGAGFEVEQVDAIPIVNCRYDADTYSYGMLATLERFAKKRLGQDLVNAWAEDLRALGEAKEYFFSLNRFVFVARKRAAGEAR